MRSALEVEFLTYTVVNPDEPDGCWHWTGAHFSNGYGRWHRGLVDKGVHVVWYERIFGPIEGERMRGPNRVVLDHTCGKGDQGCCNPYHLELVTQKVNSQRGRTQFNGQLQLATTHCPAGHPYDEANTRIANRGNGKTYRACRACARERYRRQNGWYDDA